MIGIFILCYRVSDRIHRVISQIPEDIIDRVQEIIVIDNCSDDDTVVWAKKALLERNSSKFKLILNPKNLGYGGSHKVAFDYFSGSNAQYAILFHGDGQGDIEALRGLISKAEEKRWDFVIGSRFLDRKRLSENYSLPRRWGNYFFIWLQRAVSRLAITDPGSGEVAYSLDFLKKIPYRELTDTFHFTPQLLLTSVAEAPRITEIPISWGEVETSSANIVEHGWNMLKMLIRFRLWGSH